MKAICLVLCYGLSMLLVPDMASGMGPCPRFESKEPVIPDGETASYDEMLAARNSYAEHIAVHQAYVECLNMAMRFDFSLRAVQQEQVDHMRDMADLFNAELRKYRRRNEHRQSSTLQ